MPAEKKTTTKSLKTAKKTTKPKAKTTKIKENIVEKKEITVQDTPESAVNQASTTNAWQENSSKNIYLLLGIIVVAVAIALLLFSQKQVVPWSSNLKSTSWSVSANNGECKMPEMQIDSNSVVKDWSKVKVDYIWKLEDWTIFDSSIEACAKKSPKYTPWRTLEPLPFTVWQWQMIKWFDSWVVWMKKWEIKTLTIAPKDWYWEANIEQPVETKYLKDKFDQDVPAESFKDTVVKTFPKETFWWKEYKVWDEIKASWMIWKVTAVDANGVTLSIQNTKSPFYWKKLKVWLAWQFDWNNITIKKIVWETITVTVENKQNPFYWKELKEWLTWKLPTWQEVKIIKIDWEKSIVTVPNTRDLAWKTLIFEVQVKEIE